MNVTRRKLLAFSGLVALFLLAVAYFFWTRERGGSAQKLAVMFVGITNNPVAQMTPNRVAVCRGANGLCALFSVTNIGRSGWIWFNTSFVEQKTETGWQRVKTDQGVWSGVEGGRWTPEYGCLFAVGWPSGVPTNATWRLRVRYGREPSLIGILVNDHLGRMVFRRGAEEQTIASSEAKQ